MQLPLICDEVSDFMPLNETDKAWVRETVRDAHKSHGWGKLTKFIKDWSGAGAAGAILLFALTQWSAYTEFRVHTGDRLTTIEGDLKEIKRGFAQQSLTIHASLPLAAFKATLPALASAVVTAHHENVTVSPEVLGDLQRKLMATDVATPSYWPTVAAFVSYRSFLNSSGVLSNLANCVASEPHGSAVTEVGPKGEIKKLANSYYENCRFTLDSEDDKKITALVQHGYPVIEFRHCLIIYSGGQFSLPVYSHIDNAPLQGGHGHGATLTYNGPSLYFVECIFDFSVPNRVPEQGQNVITSLLAQNGSSLTLPIEANRSGTTQ